MDNKTHDALIKYLELTKQEIINHADILWEEEKHYTWWVYIVFAGIGFLYVNPDIHGIFKVLPIFALSVFGVWASYVGYKVIKKESAHFDTARTRYFEIIQALELDKPILLSTGTSIKIPADIPPTLANRTTSEFLWEKNSGIGIRDLFKLNLIITGVAFAVIAIILLLIPWVSAFCIPFHLSNFKP